MSAPKLSLNEALAGLAEGIAKGRRLLADQIGTDEANAPVRASLLAEAEDWSAQAEAFRAGRVK